MSSPSQVYFSGIISPEPNAVLVSSIGGRGVAVGGTGVAVGDGGGPQPLTARARKITERNSGKSFFIFLLPLVLSGCLLLFHAPR
jgi:hypothetical protein